MKKGIKIFLPDYKFKKITDISPNIFLGSDLIILDIDNTLVFSETCESKKDIIEWLDNIKKDYHCILASNSRTKWQRREKIENLFGCEIFLSKRKKPSQKLFAEIKKKYDLQNKKITMVGDRIFTDILFGNLGGAKTILIEPISRKEQILIRIIRVLEKLSLFLAGKFLKI
ncbi:YqeG family HAD IIIA-type phosphatase [Patescibacteria group bacterium]|nr:YqeG family HAD IIIA-type phosphatase [Patescibacteria group bacterium]